MQSNIYNLDCLQEMRKMPDNCFDLAIVDPPYGINAGTMTMGSGKHKFSKNKKWDSDIPTKEYFEQLLRISKNQIIWGGNYFTEYLNPSLHWIVWDKRNPNLSFAEGELAWVNNGKLLRIFKHYSAMVENGGKIHPTQKPVAIYKWLLKNYAKPGDKILDTHGGSMSSVIACLDGGFQIDCYEIDKEYFDAAKIRIENHLKQTNLFSEVPKINFHNNTKQ